MKKVILLLLAAAFIFTGCKSDDSETSVDPLIGVWTWHQQFIGGVEQPLDDCDKMDTVTINANGTLNEAYYFNVDGSCEVSEVDSAIWKNLGSNRYQIIYAEGTQEEEIIEQTINFDGNTFSIEEVDDQISYKIVYIRN